MHKKLLFHPGGTNYSTSGFSLFIPFYIFIEYGRLLDTLLQKQIAHVFLLHRTEKPFLTPKPVKMRTAEITDELLFDGYGVVVGHFVEQMGNARSETMPGIGLKVSTIRAVRNDTGRIYYGKGRTIGRHMERSLTAQALAGAAAPVV